MNFIRAYLRASTEDQDASRAKSQLQDFITERGLKVASWYLENESGATLKRPELMRLISDAQDGDIILLEQVDRLARLTQKDWETLKGLIQSKGLKVVALDLPTSHSLLKSNHSEDFTSRMLSAINAMLLDMLAAVARKDYEDRRRRQAQGIETAKAQGKYKGRSPDLKLHQRIKTLRESGLSWTDIQATLGVSRATISKVLKASPDQFC